MMTSHCCQPSAVISARDVGKNGAGATTRERETARCSSEIDRYVDLRILALDQQRHGSACAGDFPLELGNRGDARAVDAEHDIAGLQARRQRRPRDVLDDQAAARVQLLLLARDRAASPQDPAAAAVLGAVARRLRGCVLEQHRLDRHLGRLAVMPYARCASLPGGSCEITEGKS